MERTAETLAARVDHMIARCRDAGMNVTPQRIAVYRALLESEEHPTPEMLFNAVSPAMPSLSLATIYKSLEALQSLGLVREVPVVRDSRRYDANLDAHHHLVCERCGSVTDYYDDDIVPLKGSKTHTNLKDAFAGESQANRRYLYFASRRTSRATPTSRACSATPPRARPATRTATSTT
jgi:Fur family transcriptional regulator, peroxide stress response regulator